MEVVQRLDNGSHTVVVYKERPSGGYQHIIVQLFEYENFMGELGAHILTHESEESVQDVIDELVDNVLTDYS